MASFPVLFGGSVALYPVTEALSIPVTVLRFNDRSEQRFQEGEPLRAYTLVLERISKAAKDSIVDFFEARLGGYDATWDISIGGVTYSNMVFERDVVEFREGEDSPEEWSATIPIRQVK